MRPAEHQFEDFCFCCGKEDCRCDIVKQEGVDICPTDRGDEERWDERYFCRLHHRTVD